MRRFALGCLLYDPERFSKMLVGDFLDAMGGYNEGENERFKGIAELVRKSTWLLWNIQVGPDDKIRDPEQFWRLPWEKDEEGVVISDEERKKIEDTQADILNRQFPA